MALVVVGFAIVLVFVVLDRMIYPTRRERHERDRSYHFIERAPHRRVDARDAEQEHAAALDDQVRDRKPPRYHARVKR